MQCAWHGRRRAAFEAGVQGRPIVRPQSKQRIRHTTHASMKRAEARIEDGIKGTGLRLAALQAKHAQADAVHCYYDSVVAKDRETLPERVDAFGAFVEMQKDLAWV